MSFCRHLLILAIGLYILQSAAMADDMLVAKPPGVLRIATFNASLYRDTAGQLADELESAAESETSTQAHALASILQTVRPDIVLINEIDYEADHRAVNALLKRYIGVGQRDDAGRIMEPLEYSFMYSGPVNTGVQSSLDLSGDGKLGDPADAWGYGKYAGQYGMVVLSRHKILNDKVRTFQNFLWSELPGAKQPIVPASGRPFYSEQVWKKLRLSSKSHWDVPIEVNGQALHLLASHPTPPAFDGPEDRNGCRNHDEIRLWTEYINNGSVAESLVDDLGIAGGLDSSQSFVIVGDLNADPADGSGMQAGIQELLKHPRIFDPKPASEGSVQAAEKQGASNLRHRGDPATDTSQFSPKNVGNLRVDYCLPSSDLTVTASGVYWPLEGQPGSSWVDASDHRLVWVDIHMP